MNTPLEPLLLEICKETGNPLEILHPFNIGISIATYRHHSSRHYVLGLLTANLLSEKPALRAC